MIPHLSDRDRHTLPSVKKTYVVGGKSLTFESGKLALLANGSVTISDDDGDYLLTTVGVAEGRGDIGYFPLQVEFQEKYYASGKIGGNRFMKREGRPADTAILNSRLIDRPIRPMFPKGVISDVQIISTILSSSATSDFGFFGITGASLALQLAGIHEFEGPVAGVRIVSDEAGNFVFDPSIEGIKAAHLDLVVAGTEDAITMVESQGREVENGLMLKAFEFAHGIIRELCAAQRDFVATYRATHEIPSLTLAKKSHDDDLDARVEAAMTDADVEALYRLGKIDFHEALHALEGVVTTRLGYAEDDEEAPRKDIAGAVYGRVKRVMRARVLSTRERLDGRSPEEYRHVRGEYGLLPRTHGSALFERGITQALTITTLGGPGDAQLIDDMYEEETKRYIHHYNFPPFSVGEVKPLRGVGRREIGHGRLAEKALEPVLPSLEAFPYFIRVVSEITTCNGSSSMASVCGSSMSLMDAGVPIKAIVAGVAMGMIYDEETRKYEILTDIQAQEDFLGDMDFKIARTERGITALQMDCKIKGLPLSILSEIFARATTATDGIRTDMTRELSSPRAALSPYAPSILSLQIMVEQIREVIGKGGETVQKIERDYGVDVHITDEGLVTVTGRTQESGQAAMDHIRNMLRGVEVGDVLTGAIIRIIDGTGAIVDLGSGKSGMIHISKLGVAERVADISQYVKPGDIVRVRVAVVDREKNRIGLERIIEG
jgi:polyribonucleotide nucleotidyltransferase